MMVAMLMSARYVYMYVTPIGDVRYVFPVTALGLVLFAKSIEWHARAGRTATATMAAATASGSCVGGMACARFQVRLAAS